MPRIVGFDDGKKTELTRFNPGNAHAWGLSNHEAYVGSGELDGDQTTQGKHRFT
jgi:hypothetical protein